METVEINACAVAAWREPRASREGRSVEQRSEVNIGAVALIDALGFRGIWGRHPPDEVLSELKTMKDWMEARVTAQFSSQPWMQCQVAFLSDTIAVSMALEQSTENRDAMSVVYLSDVISWVLDRMLRSHVPLAYRGAIAVGRYEVSPHFLLGPAIDEAAAAHEMAQGPLIWLTPHARDEVARWLKHQPHNTHLVKFDVPLKSGDSFNTYTVSPLEQAGGEDDAKMLVRTLLGTFSGSNLDVAVKLQNTVRHLRACYAWRKFALPEELSTL